MNLKQSNDLMLPAIEDELKRSVDINSGDGLDELQSMLRYHMGWEGEGAGREAQGKRVRPILLLITTTTVDFDWRKALPAAAAVELVHNFSLIHDDIQDQSEQRRGRDTVWTKWGIAQAINAGDSLFALAHISMQHLGEHISIERKVRASNILRRACLTLTQGQFLDLDYEARGDLDMKSYWPMITGKTASLLSACTEIGALISGEDDEIVHQFRRFGELVGLAFQVHDDYLGIWGDEAITGKSSASDLLTGKKSLPILFGLEQKAKFANRWNNGRIEANLVPELMKMLENEGAREYTIEKVKELSDLALDELEKIDPKGEGKGAMIELTSLLAKREG
ncbi:MAG: polyprenyl synthetase family protein [Anaerolineae bacterium]|nr:polyprenyl synthetase family protein [Anaerolineae bacterium]